MAESKSDSDLEDLCSSDELDHATIWTTPANPDLELFGPVEDMEAAIKLAKELVATVKEDAAELLRPFQTPPVTLEILRMPTGS